MRIVILAAALALSASDQTTVRIRVAGTVTPPPSGVDLSEYRTATYGTPDYYCDPTRSLASNGTGTSGDSWNMTQCMTNPVAGDVVGIKAGVSVDLPAPNNDNVAAFSPTHSGTGDAVSQRIVWVTQWPAIALSSVESNGNRTEFRHAGTPPGISGGVGTGNGGPTIGAYQQDYLTFDGFYIDMAEATISEDSGVIRPEDATGTVFKNFVIKGTATTCASNCIIYRPQDARDTLVSNFRAYDFTNDPTGSATPQAALFSDQYGDQNVIIEHGEIYNTQRGIFFKGSGFSSLGDQLNYGTVRYMLMHDLRSCWQFNALSTSQTTTVHYSVCYNVAQDDAGDGCLVFSSETSPARYLTADHLTCAKVDSDGINTNGAFIVRSNGIGSNVSVTNLALDNDGGGAFGHEVSLMSQLPATLNYNCYTKNGSTESYVYNSTQYNTFASWQAAISGRDANSNEVSSIGFADRTNNDFNITSGTCATASSTGGQVGAYATSETIGPITS